MVNALGGLFGDVCRAIQHSRDSHRADTRNTRDVVHCRFTFHAISGKQLMQCITTIASEGKRSQLFSDWKKGSIAAPSSPESGPSSAGNTLVFPVSGSLGSAGFVR